MLVVLVSKGKLAATELDSFAEVVACSGTACGTTCVGLDACPFVVDVPKTYSFVIQAVGSSQSELDGRRLSNREISFVEAP
jgi:hypothetical protein